MSYTKFTAPKKKRRVRETKESPFPVPIATITQEPAQSQKWFYYTGQLEGNHVAVKHSGDMEFLYKMGFFGKGTLSRSKPDYNQRHPTVTLPTVSGEITTAKVVNRRYYVRHLNWRNKQEDPSSELHEEYDSNQESDNEQEEVKEDGNNKEEQAEEEVKDDGTFGKGTVDAKDLEFDEFDTLVPTSETEWGDKSDSVDPWADTEADDDFWGSESVSYQNTSSEDAGKSWKLTADSDFWGTEAPQSDSKENAERQESGSSQLDIEKRKENENENHHQSHETERKNEEIENNSELAPFCKQEDEVMDPELEQEIEVMLDPLCTQEEEDGELFVIEDSDSEPEGRKRKRPPFKWQPVLKSELYPVQEFLHLSFEESFFLAYGLGCLNCLNENQKPMNLSEMWKTFVVRRKSFLPCYIVYHYFRSKGWVPKSGLKFGTDFIIYKEGPPFYHGSYSVIVRMIDEETLLDIEQYKTRHFTWTQLSGLNRVTEHVAKELMFCFVIKPSDITAEELNSPRCISRFTVHEMLVSRWVSSQEREDKGVSEIP